MDTPFRTKSRSGANQSHWFSDTEEAAGLAAELVQTEMDVYATLAFVEERPSRAEFRRIKNDEATGILGFGFDLDLAGPGHKKNDLPRGIEDAQVLWKESFPEWPATLWVNSGGGLHGYLLFEEALKFACDADRKRARALSRALSMRLKATAKCHGWTVDSVFDASRVLRVPGGYN